jgi:hypothetical protein
VRKLQPPTNVLRRIDHEEDPRHRGRIVAREEFAGAGHQGGRARPRGFRLRKVASRIRRGFLLRELFLRGLGRLLSPNRQHREHPDAHRDHHRDHRQRDESAPRRPLPGHLLVRQIEEFTLTARDPRRVLRRPRLRITQRRGAEQQRRGSPPVLPQTGLYLQRMQVLRLPRLVVTQHGLNQAVVAQLEPGAAGPRLGAHDELVAQPRDEVVAQPRALPRLLADLRAQSVDDQRAPDPLAHRPLDRLVAASDRGDHVGVVPGERRRHARVAFDVLRVDAEVIVRHRGPQAVADHLQLDRLYKWPRLRDDAAVRLLHLHGRQVLHESVDAGERPSAALRQPHRGLARALAVQQVEAERVRHLRGDAVAVRGQRRQVVLADDEQRPQLPALERLSDRREERPPLGQPRRSDGQDLLELVEHQHRRKVVPALAPRTGRHVRPQVHPCELGGAAAALGRQLLLEAEQHAQHVAVGLRRQVREPRRIEVHADRPPHVEPALGQRRRQPGHDERALARPRRRVQHEDAPRLQAVIQFAHLGVAPVQRLALLDRPRPDERVSLRNPSHRRPRAAACRPRPGRPRRPARRGAR